MCAEGARGHGDNIYPQYTLSMSKLVADGSQLRGIPLFHLKLVINLFLKLPAPMALNLEDVG